MIWFIIAVAALGWGAALILVVALCQVAAHNDRYGQEEYEDFKREQRRLFHERSNEL